MRKITFLGRIAMVLTLIFSAIFSAHSNKRIFNHYSTVEGLAHNTVNAITKDSRGYLWLGTQNGLSRFDGRQFQTYRTGEDPQQGLVDNYINGLAVDQDQGIWLTTNRGFLSYLSFEQDTLSHYTLGKIVLTDVRVLDGQSVLVGSEEGLYLFQKKEKQARLIAGTEDLLIYEIIPQSDEVLLLATSQGVYRYHIPSSVVSLMGMKGKSVWALAYHAEEGRLYANSGDRVFMLDRASSSFKALQLPTRGSMNQISSLAIFDGELWIGSELGVFIEKADGSIEQISKGEGIYDLSDDDIVSFFKDELGAMWIGTRYGGINKWAKGRDFLSFRAKDGVLKHNIVRGYAEDEGGNLWFGYVGHMGFTRFASKTYADTHFSHVPSSVYKVLPAENNKVWLALFGEGLGLYDLDKGRLIAHYTTHNSAIPHDEVQDVCYGPNGYLWLATSGGLSLFNPQDFSFINYTSEAGDIRIADNRVQAATIIFENKRAWLGTWDGISCVHIGDDGLLEKAVNYKSIDDSAPTDIPDNRITAMTKNSRSNLVVATFGAGIFEMTPQGKVIWQLNESQGAPSNLVLGVHEDAQQRLWFSTTEGLVSYQQDNQEMLIFGKQDGTQGDEYFWGGHYQRKDGTMIFSGTEGMTVFNPKDIQKNTLGAVAVINDISIMGAPLRAGQPISGGTQISTVDPFYLSDLNIKESQNLLEISFTALQTLSPERSRVDFMLEGFDEDWRVAKKGQSSVTYSNLAAGEYVFRLKAANSDGLWGRERQLAIKVRPLFYNAVWFRLSVLLFMITAVVLGFRYRIKRERQAKILLECKVAKAVADVAKQKRMLEEKYAAEADERWIEGELSALSKVLNSNRNAVDKLCQGILRRLAESLSCPLGVIYLKAMDQEQLYAAGTYGAEKSGRTLSVGEGVVGATFVDAEAKTFLDLPEDYFQTISSGLGSVKAGALYLYPIRYEEIVVGVLELGFFEPLSALQINLLERMVEMMAMRINAVQMGEQTEKLFSVSQQQAQELLQREEELRQNLEELQATQEASERQIKELEAQLMSQ